MRPLEVLTWKILTAMIGLVTFSKNFGSKYVVWSNIVCELKSGPTATTPSGLKDFANELENAANSLWREGMYGEFDTQGFVSAESKRQNDPMFGKRLVQHKQHI